MISVQLLLDPNDTEQDKLLRLVFEYTSHVFEKFDGKDGGDFSKLYSKLLMQAYKVFEVEKNKIEKPFWKF